MLSISLSVFQLFEIHLLKVLFRSVLYFFFNWIICYFDAKFLVFSVYFENQSYVLCGVDENLFPFCRLSFCIVDDVLCFTEASQFQEFSFINC